MVVEIASRLIERLVAEAEMAAPQECCGLLIGRPGRIDSIMPAANVAARPTDSFEIDPAALLRGHREARGDGKIVIGHYHSHPNGSRQPSLRDAARAVEDAQIWLIIAGGSVSGWRATSHDPGGSAVHGRFLPLALISALAPV